MDEPTLEIVKVTATQVSTSTRVLTFQAAGVGAEGDDNAAEAWDDCELAQPAGVMSRPTLTATTECVAIRRGDELLGLVIVDKGAPAQSVEEGETRIHGVGGDNATAVIRVRANGKIEITSKSGQDVVLNAGSLKVARVTDPVRVGTLVGTAGPYPVLFTFQPVDANGAPSGVPSTGATVTLSGVISNAGGAANVKA